MKSKLILILLLLFSSLKIFSQGTNNNFKHDEEDINIIFKELGISTFKFPIKQSTDQVFDIVIEEFEDGKLVKKESIINETKEALKNYGVNIMSYFKVKKDSVYFYRFYFNVKDTLLNIKVKTPRVTSPQKINLAGKSTFDFRALYKAKEEIDSLGYIEINKPKELLFLYANSDNEKDKPLWCPAGMPKEILIEKFYYVIFISIVEYNENED